MADTDMKVTPKTADEAARINCILETNILFRHLDESQKQKVQEAMFSVIKADNEVIIKQGDAGDNFYIIEVGHVVVYIETEDSPLKQVATYSVGDSFGELAIMYNAPRAATCVAKGEVRLWALDRVSYKMILMETTMAKRIEYKTFLERVPALEQLTEYEVLTIADALLEENFNDGDIVCNEGDQGDRFYFIRDGVAICTEKTTDGSTKEVAQLSSGSYFGEVRFGIASSCIYF
jgi:cAMP-dependent protein kinase regulator